ncbi:MAG: methyltransferase [Nanohaloarchaea archaeon]|nr:methyltransferase [Candidatus Nanohaloarchaea archaeon]
MKSELIQKLSKIEDFEEPKVSLEQYLTPPELAADILHTAFMQEDIEGKEVLDLGTGTGILGIGAALLGADVKAVDKDKDALEIAEQNAEKLGMSEFISFEHLDIEEVEGEYDTVVMNPPFSVHSEIGIDFLKKAVDVSNVVYTVSHPGRRKAIKGFLENSNHSLEALEQYTVKLPATYGFHTEEARETEIDVIITRRNK